MIRGGHDTSADAEPPKRNQKQMKKAVPKEAAGGSNKKPKQEEEKPPPTERQVTFQNDLDRSVDIYWVSPQDEESKMISDLEPGFTSGINTFVGHTFVARSAKGVESKMIVSRS